MKYNGIYHSDKLKKFSRINRKNQTPAEIKLWSKLRNRQLLGYKFRRQVPIANYIVDFYCEKLKLIIEIDGSTHNEDKYDYDLNRENFLKDLGYRLERFTEYEVTNNINDVLQTLENIINGTY